MPEGAAPVEAPMRRRKTRAIEVTEHMDESVTSYKPEHVGKRKANEPDEYNEKKTRSG